MRNLGCVKGGWILFAALLALGCKVNIDEPTTGKAPVVPATTTGTSTTAGGSTSAAGTTGSATGTTASSSGAATSTTSGTTTGSSSKPTEPAKGSTSTSSSTSGASQSTTPDEQKPGFNHDRIYQLFDLQTATLTINGQKLKAWIADTDSKRNEGLMFVKDKDISPDQGMLFVFPYASTQGFWMKHTYIPLDIAYIGADKAVVSTATMKAFDETNTPSKGPAQYALEMKTGTLARLGIKKGTKIDIPASVQAQDTPMGGPGMGGFPGGGFGGPPPGG